MSTEKKDSAAPQCSTKPSCQAKPCCSCKKTVFFGVLILLIAGGGFFVYMQLGGKLRATEPYRMAIEKIRKSPEVQAELGQPINDAWRTAGEPEMIRFDIFGPKGNGKVELQCWQRQGKQELRALVVTIEASGKKIDLLEGEGDAPPANYGTPAANANPNPPVQSGNAGPAIALPIPDGAAPSQGNAQQQNTAPQQNAPQQNNPQQGNPQQGNTPSPQINMQLPPGGAPGQ
jgi:hypothetical protein